MGQEPPNTVASPPTPAPLEYATPVKRTPRRWFAWLPVAWLWIVAAGPVAFMLRDPLAPVANRYRAFGLQLNASSQRVIDAINFAQANRRACVVLSLLVGFVVALISPKPQPVDRHRTAAVLLSALFLAAVFYAVCEHFLVSRPYGAIWDAIIGGNP